MLWFYYLVTYTEEKNFTRKLLWDHVKLKRATCPAPKLKNEIPTVTWGILKVLPDSPNHLYIYSPVRDLRNCSSVETRLRQNHSGKQTTSSKQDNLWMPQLKYHNLCCQKSPFVPKAVSVPQAVKRNVSSEQNRKFNTTATSMLYKCTSERSSFWIQDPLHTQQNFEY